MVVRVGWLQYFLSIGQMNQNVNTNLHYTHLVLLEHLSPRLIDPPEDDEDYPEQPLHPVPPILCDVAHPVTSRRIAVLLYLKSGVNIVNNLGGTKIFNGVEIFLVDNKYF